MFLILKISVETLIICQSFRKDLAIEILHLNI